MRADVNLQRLDRRARLTCRILAASLAGVLLSKWPLARMLFQTAPWGQLGIVVILYFGLLLGSGVGLLRVRPWGFYCAYFLVPVSTFLHGIALVPFITDLLDSAEMRVWSVMVLNLLFFVATAVAHRTYRLSVQIGGTARDPVVDTAP